MAKKNPLGLKTTGSVIESQYQSMRVEDNMAPAEVPRLLKIMSNLGFPSPAVTVGAQDPGHNSLGLDDYLSRGADPNFPVGVQLSWPNIPLSVVSQASTIYAQFVAGIWEGFGSVAAAIDPGAYSVTYRELAFKQMPELSDDFNTQLAAIASRNLPPA